MVSEPGHPAEHTDCLRDDAARMAATKNADHMPDSSNKEAVSSQVCQYLLVLQQTYHAVMLLCYKAFALWSIKTDLPMTSDSY